MIRAVLDANVLASGFAGFTSRGSAPGELLHCWRNEEYVVVCSSLLLDELEQTLNKPYFRRRLKAIQRKQAVTLVRDYGEVTELSESVQDVAPDPDDDHVLSAAVNGLAAYVVTGDKPLQSIGSYRGINVVSPREFLEILESQR